MPKPLKKGLDNAPQKKTCEIFGEIKGFKKEGINHPEGLLMCWKK